MKVLYFIDTSVRMDDKGAFNYLPSLIQELQKLVDITVCVPKSAALYIQDKGLSVSTYSGVSLYAINDYIKISRVLRECCPDIVHIHGCTNLRTYFFFSRCQRIRVPVVISPGKAFLPWHRHSLSCVFCSPWMLMLQRRMLKGSCALHAANAQEKDSLLNFGFRVKGLAHKPYNDNIAVIQNYLFSQGLSADDMAERMRALYSKVADSNPYMLMTVDDLKCEDILLIEGITPGGFAKATADDEYDILSKLDAVSMRRILLHANDEGIYKYVIDGAIRHRLHLPVLNVQAVDRFKSLYVRSSADDEVGTGIASERIDSDDTLSQTERDVCKKILLVWRKYRQNALRRSDFAALYCALRFTDYNEVLLQHALRRVMFYKRAARLLSILGERYALSEGFMPMVPLDDRRTKRMRKRLRGAGVQ